ncbi:hypothetical protein CHELA20_11128 [Hyphomicrobiales bacterium]|nr:hypothetical protein CHELA20_11128 [Hyphomicrobiales bacterium]
MSIRSWKATRFEPLLALCPHASKSHEYSKQRHFHLYPSSELVSVRLSIGLCQLSLNLLALCLVVFLY